MRRTANGGDVWRWKQMDRRQWRWLGTKRIFGRVDGHTERNEGKSSDLRCLIFNSF
uniref:Uncharacterized protein n=2 Tax=Cucumis melo TaxID=3656 RepID=A0A9I9CCY8_CUCME